jgi:hypothetical protein
MQLVEYFQGLEAAALNTASYFSGTDDGAPLLFEGSFTVPLKFSATGLTFVGKTESFLIGTFSPGTGGIFTASLRLFFAIGESYYPRKRSRKKSSTYQKYPRYG